MSEANETVMSGRGPDEPTASWVASQIGRMTLRWSRYPGRRLVGSYMRKVGRRRGGEGFTVHTDDGVKLDAWYSPAVTPKAGRLPIVMMHGWIEMKEFHFKRAWRLNRAGHDVILFDHRAHGRSTGRSATFGARECGDLSAVIQRAQQRGYLGERYITMGFSMGAAVALQQAAGDANVAGVVAFAPFATFDQAIRDFREKLAPWMDESWLMRGFDRAVRDAGFTYQEASTLEAIQQLDAPVLLIEAGCDTNLPPAAHTQKLVAAKTRGTIELVTIDEATHCSICRRPWPGLNRTVSEFCKGLG